MKKLNTFTFSDINKILKCIPGIIQKTSGNGRNIKPPSDNDCIGNEDSERHQRPEIITVADIGNHKIVVFIARLNANKKIEIIGFSEEKAEGVTKGFVSNILKLSKCLKTAIDKAAEQAGFVPKSIYAGVSCTIKTHKHQEILIRKNKDSEINECDITTLATAINRAGLYADENILYIEPQHFNIDGEDGIINPIGMVGTTLETTFKVITCPSSCIKSLERCCDLLDISLKAVYPSIIASAKSVLHEEEITEGVVIVDIGAGKSSVAIYKDGHLSHAETIPFGGNSITNDICKYSGLFFRYAEEIKIKYANAIHLNINPNETIEAKLFNHYKKNIFLKDLAFVIQCRLTEILELVDYIISSKIDKKHIHAGIIFTGGTSTIPLFKQLSKVIINTDCFIYSEVKSIFTSINPKIKNQLNNPLYTSALGILRLGFGK